MSAYGQFCPVAKAMELLDERWTLLVVRELLQGSAHFNDLRRGVPKMSPALLSKRLKSLTRAGLVERTEIGGRSTYSLTECGQELSGVVDALGAWGVRWIGELGDDDLDPHLLMWDMQRHIPIDGLAAGADRGGLRVDRRHAQGITVVAGGRRGARRHLRLRPGLRRRRHRVDEPSHAHPDLARRHLVVAGAARRQRRRSRVPPMRERHCRAGSVSRSSPRYPVRRDSVLQAGLGPVDDTVAVVPDPFEARTLRDRRRRRRGTPAAR